jgi:hypothetical protein
MAGIMKLAVWEFKITMNNMPRTLLDKCPISSNRWAKEAERWKL